MGTPLIPKKETAEAVSLVANLTVGQLMVSAP